MNTLHFSNIIILENRKSMNARDGHQYLTAIQNMFSDATFSIFLLGNKPIDEMNLPLREDSLLCIMGGDGTMNSVVQALLQGNFSQAQRKTPILPLWGGNANDLAHMLNGQPSVEACRRAFKKGRIVPIHPLRCTIASNGTKTIRLAICYTGFGATAHAARHLNEKAFRKNPLHALPGGQTISEVALSLKAFRDAPTFVIEQDGKRKVVYDWIIGKGPRMAKLGRLPIELTDQAFYQGMLEHKSLPDVVSRVFNLVWGNVAPSRNTESITFTTTETIWAQFDGEPLKIPAHATVTIGLNPEPFYALSHTLSKKKPATLKA